MGHGTRVLWCFVVRRALYQYICISLYFFCCTTLFCHCVLYSSRLDLEYMCTLNRVTFIPSMSNRWEQELQRCLEADVDFDVGDFIAQHPQIAPRNICRRHAAHIGEAVAQAGEPWSALVIHGKSEHGTSASRQGFYWGL